MSHARSSSTLSRIKASMRRVPPVAALVAARQRRLFLSPAGLATHWGVYATFDEARLDLPPSRGYDADAVVDDVRRRTNRLYNYDYPAIFWLGRAFDAGSRSVFDIGGALGVHFFGYQRVLPFPQGVEWTVCELPATVRRGREVAAARGAANLHFVDRLDTRDVSSDVWLAAGALQYTEHGDLPGLIRAAATRPRTIILNKLPLYEGDDFVATQNIGGDSFSPTWIWNRQSFVERVVECGYRVADEWDVPERDFYLPGHPERCFASFSGLCFEAGLASRGPAAA
jgi:putative methyltransferase (TIGR04325 family)